MPTVQVDFTDEEFPFLQKAIQGDPRGRDLSQYIRGCVLEKIQHFVNEEKRKVMEALDQNFAKLDSGERAHVREVLDRARERG